MLFNRDDDAYAGSYITGPTYLHLKVSFGDGSSQPVVAVHPSEIDPEPEAHDPNRYLEFAQAGLLQANEEFGGNLSINTLDLKPSETPGVAGFAKIIVYRIASRILTGGDFPFQT